MGPFAPVDPTPRAPRAGRVRRRAASLGMLVVLLAGLPGGVAAPAPAAAAITSAVTADQLAAAIVGSGVTLLGTNTLTLSGTSGSTPDAVGTSDASIGGFSPNGGSFAILTTGSAATVTSGGSTLDTSLGGGNLGHGGTVYDIASLQIDFSVTGSGCLLFDYKFLSEEYPQYVSGAAVDNDAFIAQLDSNSWSASGSQVVSASNNMALDLSGGTVGVATTGRLGMNAPQGNGTAFDGAPQGGATPKLTARRAITAGTHSLYLTIFDQGAAAYPDGYDSAVFVDNLRWTSAGCSTPNGTITLDKFVDSTLGGSASKTSWTLTGASPTQTGTAKTFSGAGNTGAQTVQPGIYRLSETGSVPGYTDGTAAGVLWSCTNTALMPNYKANTRLNHVWVLEGQTVTCTITNRYVPPKLTLSASVDNSTGGTALVGAFVLSATKTTGPASSISGTTGDPKVAGASVLAGDFLLATAGPNGYVTTWTCTGAPAPLANVVSITEGSTVSCAARIVYKKPSLTLTKSVIGGSALPTAWVLTAASLRSRISGAGGTTGDVTTGVFTLSETTGATGYTRNGWTCTDRGLPATMTDGTHVSVTDGAVVTCVSTSTLAATAKVTLRATVDNLAGGSATTASFPLSATGPMTIAGVTDSTAATNVPAVPGGYRLAVSGPAGYRAGAWSCVGAPALTDGTTVAVTDGSTVTCTIPMTYVKPTLTLTVRVDNTSGGTIPGTALASDWVATASGASQTLTGYGSATGGVASGWYALSTSADLPGYRASPWVCTGAPALTDGTSLSVTDGSTVACVTTRTYVPPRVTLAIRVENTAGTPAAGSSWTLSASGSLGSLAGAGGTTGDLRAGSYRLGLTTGPAGYRLIGWSCTGAPSLTDGVTVSVTEGSTVACTSRLLFVKPTLTIVKIVDNLGGRGTADATAWTLTATGRSTLSGAGRASGEVTAGTYRLREAGGPAGYAASVWTCTGAPALTDGTTVSVTDGASVTCSITNTYIPPGLTLTARVDASAGGSALATDWTLGAVNVADPTATISGVTGGASVTGAIVRSGWYRLSAANGPAGYRTSVWTCTGAPALTDGTTVSVTDGSTVACSIVQTYVPPRLTLVVTTESTAGTPAPATGWTAAATGPTRTLSGGGGTSGDAPAGSYALALGSGPLGYRAGPWACTGATMTDATHVSVTEGSVVACRIALLYVKPLLAIAVTLDQRGGWGSADATAWTVSATGTRTALSGAGSASGEVSTGTFTLRQVGGPAWYAPAARWQCAGGSMTDGTHVTVSDGSTVECSIALTYLPPTLTLRTVVSGGSSGPGAFLLTAESTSGIPAAISGTSGSGSVTAAPVPVGSYRLGQSGGPAWYAASPWACVGGFASDGTRVEVSEGSSVVCTVTQTYLPPRLTLVKLVANGMLGTAEATAWTVSATNGTRSLSGAGGTSGDAAVGTWTLGQTAGPAGYASGAWECLDRGQPAPMSDGTHLVIADGAEIVCSSTSTYIPPGLTLTAEIVGDGPALATDWRLSATNVVTGARVLDGPTPQGSTALAAGSYRLDLTGGSVWYTSSGWICSGATVTGNVVSVSDGARVSCRVELAYRWPRLTLSVSVVGATPATAWTLSASGTSTGRLLSGTTGSTAVTDAHVLPDTFELAIGGGPDDYLASAWTCLDGGLPAAMPDPAHVSVSDGATIACSIVETYLPPAILTLAAEVSGGTGSIADVPLSATRIADGRSVSGTSESPAVTAVRIGAGSYRLAALAPLGYVPGAWACEGGAVTGDLLEASSGATIVCRIVATWRPTRITLVNTVTNLGGGTAKATAWTLLATGPATVTGATGSVAVTSVLVPSGTFALWRPKGPSGYASTAWTCTGATRIDATHYRADVGATVRCTVRQIWLKPYLAKGTFVAFKGHASVGSSIVWWSPRWNRANGLGTRTSLSGFYGFSATVSSYPARVGGRWSGSLYASTRPPRTLPTLMAVVVASSISRSGTTVYGNVYRIVLVKRSSTTFGLGTVVAVLE